MNREIVVAALKEVWYLVLLLAVIVVVLLYKAFGHTGETPSAARTAPVVALSADELHAASAAAEENPRPTEQDKARGLIADYQKRLREAPKGPDAPALLNAMANLSRQKLDDYRDAVHYYELLIADYPDWEGIARVYPQLATCYERSGDIHGMQDVYKRMMQKFPPESQEYLYAKSQLER